MNTREKPVVFPDPLTGLLNIFPFYEGQTPSFTKRGTSEDYHYYFSGRHLTAARQYPKSPIILVHYAPAQRIIPNDPFNELRRRFRREIPRQGQIFFISQDHTLPQEIRLSTPWRILFVQYGFKWFEPGRFDNIPTLYFNYLVENKLAIDGRKLELTRI